MPRNRLAAPVRERERERAMPPAAAGSDKKFSYEHGLILSQKMEEFAL
jgi:hypothetical protein